MLTNDPSILSIIGSDEGGNREHNREQGAEAGRKEQGAGSREQGAGNTTLTVFSESHDGDAKHA